MGNNPNILKSLAMLDELCPSGYAMALHITYTTPRFLFQTYDRKWIAEYSQKGLVLKDPTVMWGFENLGRQKWSDLSKLDTDGVLKLAAANGLKHGFTFSLSQDDSKSINSFARSDREFTDDEMDAICDLVTQIHADTSELIAITDAEKAELKKMSVEFTHG